MTWLTAITGLFSAVAKLAGFLAAYRAGRDGQRASTAEKSLEAASAAQEARNEVAGIDDTAVRDRLHDKWTRD